MFSLDPNTEARSAEPSQVIYISRRKDSEIATFNDIIPQRVDYELDVSLSLILCHPRIFETVSAIPQYLPG